MLAQQEPPNGYQASKGLSPQPTGDADPYRCTWLIQLDLKVIEGPEDVPEYRICNKRATVLFSRATKNRRPDQPKYMIYPRCKVHDTPAARSRMGLDGYDIEELP
jgi:hypothetical protein